MSSRFDSSQIKIRKIVPKSAKRIRDVAPIHLTVNTEIKDKSDLPKIVEEPCLPACQDLYDKNIKIEESNSNRDSPYESYIAVNDKYLSAENKAIIARLLKSCKITRYDYGGPNVKFGLKTNPDMLVSDVSRQLSEMLSVLHPQDMLYNFITPKGLADEFNAHLKKYPKDKEAIFNQYGVILVNGVPSINPQKYAKNVGGVYDPETGNVYTNRESFRKHKVYANLVPKAKTIKLRPPITIVKRVKLASH